MQYNADNESLSSELDTLTKALASGAYVQVRRLLADLNGAEIAHLIESSPPHTRHALWQLLTDDIRSEVVPELNEEIRTQFLEQMAPGTVADIAEDLEIDDLADVLQQLPSHLREAVLSDLSLQDRQRIERMMSYDEDTAGGLMNTDTITVRAAISLDVVLRYLRRHDDLPEMTDSLFVVNRDDKLIGLLPITRLLTADPSVMVREVMLTDIEPIFASLPANEVAQLFERNDWVSAPVVDENGVLLGRITIDDVVDVIIEEADHSLMSLAGLDEDSDTFASVKRSMPRRAVWLGINLLTALIASSSINLFQNTIHQVVMLAVLMPIVASMGGVAGTQTLTLIIRSMALGHINRNNLFWLLNREVMVGMLNGLFWAIGVGVVVGFVCHDYRLGLCLGLAMIINLVIAALVGTLLPPLLKKMHIDPAIAGGVILTTFTDVGGFVSFLGLATLFYM